MEYSETETVILVSYQNELNPKEGMEIKKNCKSYSNSESFLQYNLSILTNKIQMVSGTINNVVKSEVVKINSALDVDLTSFKNGDNEQDNSLTLSELENNIDFLGTHPPISPNLTDVIDVVKDLLIDCNENSTVKFDSNMFSSLKQSTTLTLKLRLKRKNHYLREDSSIPRVELYDESIVLNETE